MKFENGRPRAGGRCGRRGWTSLGGALLALALACVASEPHRLSCDDVYDASEVGFEDVLAIMRSEEEGGGGKGCGGGPCHRAEVQQNGVRLDTPELVYEEMSARPDVFYAYLASGEMPLDEEPWSEEELKIFRSWYCAGAFPP
jgi:hypothetical protein